MFGERKLFSRDGKGFGFLLCAGNESKNKKKK